MRFLEISPHAIERYRERVLTAGELDAGEKKIKEHIAVRLAAAEGGPLIRDELWPWLRHVKPEHQGRSVSVWLHRESRAVFLVKHPANGGMILLTCFKAVCKACKGVHGVADCPKDRQRELMESKQSHRNGKR